jgi:tRNA-2-methylthio-N6-dimethylallyladenosine synthase
MEGQIDEQVSKDSIMRLIELQNSINRNQSTLYKDKVVEVLCEGFDEKKNMYLGRDTYSRMVYFNGTEELLGKFVNVQIEKTGGISLIGKIVD